jgi:hypothetical protein
MQVKNNGRCSRPSASYFMQQKYLTKSTCIVFETEPISERADVNLDRVKTGGLLQLTLNDSSRPRRRRGLSTWRSPLEVRGNEEDILAASTGVTRGIPFLFAVENGTYEINTPWRPPSECRPDRGIR